MKSRAQTLFFLVITLAVGCTKEGPAGPQGPVGAGGGLSVEVLFFENPSSTEWNGSGPSSFSTTLNSTNITESVLLNGFVKVHFYQIHSGDTTYSLLPFTVDTIPPPAVTYLSEAEIGSVTVRTQIPNGFHLNPGVMFPGSQYGFRVAAAGQ